MRLGRLHQQLKHQLRDFAIEVMNRGAEGDPRYGQILQVAVDSSLYLLERDDTGWKVRLAVESELKKDVSTAQGWPVYGFSKAGLDSIGPDPAPGCPSHAPQ